MVEILEVISAAAPIAYKLLQKYQVKKSTDINTVLLSLLLEKQDAMIKEITNGYSSLAQHINAHDENAKLLVGDLKSEIQKRGFVANSLLERQRQKA